MKKSNDNKEILIYGLIIAILIIIMVGVNNPSSYIVNGNLSNVIISPIDELSSSLQTISFEHHEMHEGDHYFIKTYSINTGGSGTSDYFSFTTPVNSKTIHARALLSPDIDYLIEIYEGGNVSGGVSISGINNNRNSNNTALLIPLGAPTVIDEGNLIWASRNGGGKNPVGVSPGFNYEIIAKSNTTYIFKLTKQVVQIGIVNIDFWWYEHSQD